MRNIQNESGRTMLEMLGVLAIMGVIMYGAIAGISFGVESFKINATFNLLEELSQGVIDLYSWSPTYNSSGAEIENVVCQNDVVECNSGYKSASGGEKIKTQLTNSTITIGSTGDRFVIYHHKLSNLACSRLSNMTYSNLCVRFEDENKKCGIDHLPAGFQHTNCDEADGNCVLVLISR